MPIKNDVQQGWHDAIIEMFEIDLSTIEDGLSGQYFFTNEVMPDNSSVVWKGQTYTSFPIEASGFDVTTKGQMPQPEITVANVLGTFSAVISSANDLVGAKVIRRRTLFKYLDNGPTPDSTQEFPEDIFYIERKTAETNITVSWQLASKIDLEGLLLPRRVITQNHCLWRYKGPECGYSGPPVANELDSLPGSASAEAQAYRAALEALLQANSAVISAENELNAATGDVDIACAVDIIERSEPLFNLRRSNGPYTFGILDGTTYFAAYYENQLIPPAQFDYDPANPQEGNAIMGLTQNTGRGPGNNGTGNVWAINQWIGVEGPPLFPGGPNSIEAEIVTEGEYDPPSTFAFRDLDGQIVACRNGSILSAISNAAPGTAPSIGTLGQIVFARGERRDNNVAPVVDIQIWRVSTAQCDAARERLQAAETQLAEAEAAVIAAQATFDAALAALPPNDPIFNNDQCGKRLTSCRLRFGLSTLPFGAFPGANLFR
jgi:lambda family phage minor tail protein L